MGQVEEWTEIINGKKRNVRKYVFEKAVCIVHGEPNIDVWARKLIQVYDDMKAGRYDKEES
ncbi:hypothetical protein [Priestia aryabhattai]|uniref:hypothetical protein n=1 Tax=Priestia aryabhattai TaxID=412384 RepID=UPI002659D395|nr:hypothetical protein [Priestia aryabhattai]WKG31601.1 hypothetical protein QYS54_05455 [Priestia aryabhattai]